MFFFFRLICGPDKLQIYQVHHHDITQYCLYQLCYLAYSKYKYLCITYVLPMYTQDVNAKSNRNKKKRQCKIIWFNPPFSKSVKTNLGKEFFKLLKRHFPKCHKMSKIFNKNTVKLSYSCCRNISSKISSNNRRIINPPPTNYGCIVEIDPTAHLITSV